MTKLNQTHFYSGVTDTGKKRDHNEDYFIVDESIGLLMVCDGMGGHAAGEVASEVTGKVTHEYLKEQSELFKLYESKPTIEAKNQIKMHIDNAIQNACKAVWDEAQADANKNGMGTTIVLLLICGNSGFVAHVGDSRAYLYREGSVKQLTTDHTLVNELLKEGVITREQAVDHPQSNVVMRSVGIQEGVKVDVLHLELMNNDKFILCSDGLSDYLKSGHLKQFFEKREFETLSEELVRFANSRGGKDNITVLSCGFRQEDELANKRSEAISKKIKTLQNIPLFNQFTYQELMKLLDIITVKAFEEGENVVVEGETGDEMYVILRGEASTFLKGACINTIVPGNYFGEMVLIDEAPRMATVKTSQRCKMLVLKREPFFKLLGSDTSMASKVFWAFLLTLNNRLRIKENELLKLKKSA